MANRYTATPIPSDLAERYQEGYTQAELAIQYGVSQHIVFGWMRRAGIKARVAAKRDQRGEKNSSWRGVNAKYQALHIRVEVARGKPKHCDKCGTVDPSKSYDWANLTGKYDDVNDYKRLCRSCHWKLDKKILNISRSRTANYSRV